MLCAVSSSYINNDTGKEVSRGEYATLLPRAFRICDTSLRRTSYENRSVVRQINIRRSSLQATQITTLNRRAHCGSMSIIARGRPDSHSGAIHRHARASSPSTCSTKFVSAPGMFFSGLIYIINLSI